MFKIKGILVVNHFLKGEKFDALNRALLQSALENNVKLELKTNLELSFEKEFDCNFALFWDKDIALAERMEKSGIRLFNSARSIELCDDKARTCAALSGVAKMPETLVAPKTYFKSDMSEFVNKAIEILGVPLVFKECFGSFGEQVFLCKTKEDVMEKITARPFILQEYVENSSGRDKRLEVVGGKVIAAMRRVNENDFRSNLTNGGKMFPCTASESEKVLAVNACAALGLDFGGVDILDGEILCEVNSNAHIINISQCTGINAADLIFKHILSEMKK